jgi:hypothetical protein
MAPTGASMARDVKGERELGGRASVRFVGGVVTYTVTIDPRRAHLLHFGAHTLDIPAHAICDGSGGYGPQVFDQPCRAENKPVTITAQVRATAAGIPRIDLLPQMRFHPSQTVTLTLRVPSLTPASTGSWNILYCASHLDAVCIDESQLHPELSTHVDYEAGTLSRRIDHFSGYFVES